MRSRTAWLATVLLLAACSSSRVAVSSTTASSTTTSAPLERPIVDPDDFEVGDLTDTEPLNWSTTLSSPLRFVDMVEVGSRSFVVATDPDTGGAYTWSSVDGLSWSDHGNVAPPSGGTVGAVGSDGRHLLIALEAPPGQGPIVLMTEDGESWSAEQIPFDPDNPLAVFAVDSIGGIDTVTVVAGRAHPDPSSMIADKLEASGLVGSELLAESSFSFREVGSDVAIEWTGPFGFKLAKSSAAEIGMTTREQQWMLAEDFSTAMDVWARTSGGVWQPSRIDGAVSVLSLFGSTGGEIFATGATGTGVAMWSTFEGLSWEKMPFAERPLAATHFGNRLIGLSLVGESDVLVSDDGSSWERTDLQLHMPALPDFFVTFLAGSDHGVVATMESFQTDFTGKDELEIPSIVKGDLRIFGQTGGVSIFEGEIGDENSIQHDFFASASTFDERMLTDLESETLTFLRSDGTELVTLGLNELEDLWQRFQRLPDRFDHVTLHAALGFSTDASTWSLWDIGDLLESTDLLDIGLAEESVIIALATEPGFDVRTAQPGTSS